MSVKTDDVLCVCRTGDARDTRVATSRQAVRYDEQKMYKN